MRVLPHAEIAPFERDVFCYFDNTDKLHAPRSVRRCECSTSSGIQLEQRCHGAHLHAQPHSRQASIKGNDTDQRCW